MSLDAITGVKCVRAPSAIHFRCLAAPFSPSRFEFQIVLAAALS